MESKMVVLSLVAAAVVLFTAAPAIVAFLRRHPQARRIARLCPWTFFSLALWAALMTWAMSDADSDTLVSRTIKAAESRNLFGLLVTGLVLAGIIATLLVVDLTPGNTRPLPSEPARSAPLPR